VGVVVDAELVGHGEQQRVGGRDRLVLLELLDKGRAKRRLRAAALMNILARHVR
jgi:hypothetical protein